VSDKAAVARSEREAGAVRAEAAEQVHRGGGIMNCRKCGSEGAKHPGSHLCQWCLADRGVEDAKHKDVVDQLKRIADVLGRIAVNLDAFDLSSTTSAIENTIDRATANICETVRNS
jgi:hypothetical protein